MSDLRIDALPQPRVDMVGYDPATRESRRRTEYSGTLWLGDKPNVTGRVFSISGTPIVVDAGIFIPDSLPYVPASLDAVIAATVAIQSQGGDEARITDYRAELVPDPRGQPVAWLQLRLVGRATLGTALSYQIVVVVAPEAVAS
jgi:hypothetical protein